MVTKLKQLSVCPICGNQAFPEFSVPCDYRKPHNSPSYQIYWCPDCHYGQVWERPSPAQIADFYQVEDYYTHEEKEANNQESLSFLDRLRKHISWRLDGGEDLTPYDVKPLLTGNNLSICEIGCGNGGNLAKFLAEGFSVVGVEPDPTAREVAKRSVVNVFAGTAEELPEAVTNQQYDVVLMSHVLEHCLDINAAVANAKKVLRPGGIFLVETPNCQSRGFKSYQGEWPWSDIPRHLNFFTPYSLQKILSKYGFEVEETKYSGFCRQFSNSWLKEEEVIWSAFDQASSQQNERPNFKARAWKMLISSLLAKPADKYDSVRLIGVKKS